MSKSVQNQNGVSGSDKVQLYFCRHAESRHNAYGESTTDVDLSELGETQAKSLTGQFDLVLCSPMRRARHTLELSSIRYGRLEVVPELREWVYDNSDRLPGDPKGHTESQGDVAKRCETVRARLLSEIAAASAANGCPYRILLVSHGLLGDMLYAMCCRKDQSGYIYIDNAVIYPFPFSS